MHRHWEWSAGKLGLAVMLVGVVSCGSDGSSPSQTAPTIAKATTKSGDEQTGIVSEALPSELRVMVTRDGNPARDVAVAWATGDGGALAPASGTTDADGVSSSIWTLGSAPGPQTATASVTGGVGSPVSFSATATGGGGGGTIIQVGADGLAFMPAAVTVIVGTTVTWEWAGALNHNVAPDGTIPIRSGPLVAAPRTYQYTFDTPGTYAYYCEAHGARNGIGMAGTVTVVTAQP
ncbi:MAG: plastocyanin/azurin family copper-binding protein [Gemmatimonadales bacterium]